MTSRYAGLMGAIATASACAGCSRAPTDGPVGFAALDGGTDGGAGGDEVTVTTAADLVAAVARAGPLTIVIDGDVAVPALALGSHTTLAGAPGAVLRGGVRIAHAHDVIVRDLVVEAATSRVGDGDGIGIVASSNVWIDHVAIRDAADGELDITEAASDVTVSWTRFDYSAAAPAPGHRFATLVGADDGATGDRGHLDVTFHHDWWGPGVVERMPRVRFGRVHLFDCYLAGRDSKSGVRAGLEAKILIENSVFDGVVNPHERRYDQGTGRIVARGNRYEGTRGARDADASAFDPPYAYRLDPVAEVEALVTAHAGPR